MSEKLHQVQAQAKLWAAQTRITVKAEVDLLLAKVDASVGQTARAEEALREMAVLVVERLDAIAAHVSQNGLSQVPTVVLGPLPALLEAPMPRPRAEAVQVPICT